MKLIVYPASNVEVPSLVCEGSASVLECIFDALTVRYKWIAEETLDFWSVNPSGYQKKTIAVGTRKQWDTDFLGLVSLEWTND